MRKILYKVSIFNTKSNNYDKVKTFPSLRSAKNYTIRDAKNKNLTIEEIINVITYQNNLSLVIYRLKNVEFDESNRDSNYPYMIEEIPFNNNRASR